MEEVLKETAKSVPNLAVLAVIVWMFVKHLDRRGELFSAATREQHNDHLAAREEMVKVITDNTAAIREISEAVTAQRNQ